MKTIQEVKNAKKSWKKIFHLLFPNLRKRMKYRFLRWEWKPLAFAMVPGLMQCVLR